MASSIEQFVQFIRKHQGATKYNIAVALGFDYSWVNRELYNESKKPNSRLYKDDSVPPRWYFREEVNTMQPAGNPQKRVFVHDEYTRSVMDRINAGKNVYVTGKAGTGKTRLLEEIYRENEQRPANKRKVIVVVAPTGVAAEHIKESAHIDAHTIHSFFRLPLTPYAAGFENDDLYSLNYDEIEAIKGLDLLIIDEISMVRCDVLDAVDAVLRHYRKSLKPFGGVQIALFGDLYQLMPVAKQEEWTKIEDYYETYYFFSSHALSKLDYYYCELHTPHRQEDKQFVDILNAIREAKMTLKDMEVVNSRYVGTMPSNQKDSVVILKTKNKPVNNYNKEKLAQLPGEVRTYYPYCDPEWHGKKPIDPPVLHLKVGAKVMFLKNDTINENYRNGTIGYVESMSDEAIVVRIAKNKLPICVTKQTWDQYDFKIDKKEKRIITEVRAQFKQFPLKLAWAVTVHKSQGLTLDQVILDVADSFTFGQIYVALSRCTTLQGIQLEKKIPSHKIMVDRRVIDFRKSVLPNDKIGDLPSYKYDGSDSCPDNTVELPITVSRLEELESLRRGERNKYERSISDIETAKQVFVYSGGRFVPNSLYCHLNKRWTYNDMNEGNCPLAVRDCKYVKIRTKDNRHSSLFVLNEPIRIDKYDNSDNWTCTVIVGRCLDDNYKNKSQRSSSKKKTRSKDTYLSTGFINWDDLSKEYEKMLKNLNL